MKTTLLFIVATLLKLVLAAPLPAQEFEPHYLDGTGLAEPTVLYCWGQDDTDPFNVKLNEWLHVKVHLLDQVLTKDVKLDDIVLVLNGIRFEGIHAQAVDKTSNVVTFRLALDDYSVEQQRKWSLLLGSPSIYPEKVTVTIGNVSLPYNFRTLVSGNNKIDRTGKITDVRRGDGYVLQLTVLRPWYLAIASILCLALIGVVGSLAIQSEMLKVPSSLRTGDTMYSLSLTQMAFWYVIVVMSSIFLWVVTGLYVPITPSVLGILGISTVTTLSAAGIDFRKAKKTDFAPATKGGPSQKHNVFRLFKDITTDSQQEFSLQRLQVVVWTLLFGMFYTFQVWQTARIPEIDASMLVLMGITSAAYLGSKVPD